MKNAVIISGKLVQDHEFIYPYYRLLEENINVDVCLLGGKPVSGVLGTAIPPNKDHEVIDIDDCSPDKYDLLVIPGGALSLMYLRQSKKVINFIVEFNRMKKTIASICHGPQLLISAQIVKGKKISGYYSIKDDIQNAGAIYVDEPAVIDNNIITTSHYKYLGQWMKKTIEVLNDR